MEVRAMHLKGLVTPLKTSCKKPSERQYNPPQSAGSAKEIEQKKNNGTVSVFKALLYKDGIFPAHFTVDITRNVLATSNQADNVGNAVNIIAHCQKDDWLFGIADPLRVYQKSQNSEKC